MARPSHSDDLLNSGILRLAHCNMKPLNRQQSLYLAEFNAITTTRLPAAIKYSLFTLYCNSKYPLNMRRNISAAAEKLLMLPRCVLGSSQGTRCLVGLNRADLLPFELTLLLQIHLL